MRLKIFLPAAFLFIIAILWGVFFIHKSASIKSADSSRTIHAAHFTNLYADLLLENIPSTSQEFLAYLRVSSPQCSGNLAQKGSGGLPAHAFLTAGTLSNGTLRLYQPPTMGEAACGLELKIHKDEIIAVQQTEGDCNAWHGPTCSFSTPLLGGMKNAPGALDRRDANT